MEGLKKEILLSFFPKITSKRYQKILAFFNSLDDAWKANKDEWKNTNWKKEVIDEFFIWKENIDEEKINKILNEEKMKCLTIDSPNYPKLLKKVYDPPFCLFVRGELNSEDYFLAVVGPRKNSFYGKQMTEKMVSELSQKGLIIVSGLAFGIDSIAHKTCLKNNTKTIAVLGSGIDKNSIYPKNHIYLAEEIIQKGGAVISEYPPGTTSNIFTFPRRNRIIAGMSYGVFIIEAREKSGALITASYGLESGREIFTIPQNINSETSAGTNNLLKQGANLITDSQEIMEILNLQNLKQYVKNKKILGDTKEEKEILKFLSYEAIHVDDIIKKTKISSQKINSALVLMEMKGLIKNLGGMMYILKN